MGQSQNTEIQIFAGGLNLKSAAHLINQTEARQLSNVNIRSLNLQPYRKPLFVEFTTAPYMFYFLGEFRYFPQWRSNVIWNRAWYWSDMSGTGKMLRDGTEMTLGIAPPVTRPTVEVATPGTDKDGISGNINYVYTYYHADTGAESPPSPPSETLDIEDSAVKLSDFENTTEYSIRIYRIGGIITAYTAVETVGGAVTDYTDDNKFSEIEATILDTLRAFPPPAGLVLLTEHQGRFYGCVDSKLYYTAAGKPDSWYNLDFISFDETISMIASVSGGLLVATVHQTFIITGNRPVNFGKYLISESEGCVSPVSAKVLDNAAIWLSGNGFMMSNGSGIQNISMNKLGSIKGIDPRGCVIYDGLYIMSFGGSLVPTNDLVPGPDGGDDEDPSVGNLVPGATQGNARLPEGAIVIDFSFGEPVFTTLAEPRLGDLGYYNNKLYQITMPDIQDSYISDEDGRNKLVTENGLFNLIADLKGNQARMEMFSALDLTRITYSSPIMTDGSIGVLKQYEKVRVTFTGIIQVDILDDSLSTMQSQTLRSIKRTSTWIGIPVERNRGYGIKINIKGVGIVDSISYTWAARESQ